MAPSTALAKRPSPADTALMPPPPPVKRIKRPLKVLDEDIYTSALSHIIARDFFPGLLETESTQDYLNALDTGDEEWIDEAEKRVREVLSTPQAGRRGVSLTPRATGFATPRGGNWSAGTPMSTPGHGGATPAHSHADASNPYHTDPVNLNLSPSDFQRKYTSEDNESFNKVLDKQNTKHREKYRWLWNGNKIPSARQIAQAAQSQKLLTQKASTDERDARFGTSAADLEGALIVKPSQDPDTRPASISQIRPHEPRNTFMFAPDADISDSHPHLLSTYQSRQDASHAPPKSVSYASTRLPTNALPSDSHGAQGEIPESPSLSAIDAAIAGHPRHRSFSTAAPSEMNDGGTGGETPRVSGYTFVDAEPTAEELALLNPPPAEQAETRSAKKVRDRNELLQHLLGINDAGEASLGGGNTAPNPFNLQSKSRREDLHHRMVDRQLASKRIPAAGAGRLATLRTEVGKTATPKFLSSPIVNGRMDKTPTGRREKMDAGNLTPAAQSLYSRVGRTPVRGGGFDGSGGEKGRGGWTPKTLVGVRARRP